MKQLKSVSKKSAKKNKIKILLVDDHPIVRQGITRLVQSEGDLIVCGEAEDDHQALVAIETVKPDIVLIDITLKRGSGLDLLKCLTKQFPEIHTIVLSMHDASIYAERVLRAGAKGYVMKQESNENLIKAIRRVLQGHVYIDQTVQDTFLQRMVGNKISELKSSLELLSDRELEVFQLIGQGYSSRIIAGMIHLSVKTIDSYREHIKKKMKWASSHELVYHATRWVQNENIPPDF